MSQQSFTCIYVVWEHQSVLHEKSSKSVQESFEKSCSAVENNIFATLWCHSKYVNCFNHFNKYLEHTAVYNLSVRDWDWQAKWKMWSVPSNKS